MTSKTKWPRTPGEWTAEAPEYVWVSVSRNGESFDICRCCGETSRPGNAHLIAAAPELYEALALLRSTVGDEEFAGRGWSGIARKADAALAKASGES